MSWVGTLGRWMFRLAIFWLAMIPVLFAGSFAYDALYHSHDMNLPGLLAAAALVYFFYKPLGLGLLVAGFFMRRFDDG